MVILAAVDRSDRGPNVLREADVLAEKFDETIHVLHVMKRSEAIQAEGGSLNEDKPFPVDQLRGRAARTAEELLEEYPTSATSESHGLIGDPATEIVNYAERNDVRYIVVSPKRRSQAGKMLFGSVAQSVLLNATCPVLALS